MIQTVVKRDGRIVGFNEQKIMAAIRKAMLHTDKGEDTTLIEQITDHISYRGKSQMSVEAIQDAIEMELMKSARKDVAQKYIAYRNQRNIARKAKTRDVFMSIVNAKNNDITRENANMNADTPAGMMMKFASETNSDIVPDQPTVEILEDNATVESRSSTLRCTRTCFLFAGSSQVRARAWSTWSTRSLQRLRLCSSSSL